MDYAVTYEELTDFIAKEKLRTSGPSVQCSSVRSLNCLPGPSSTVKNPFVGTRKRSGTEIIPEKEELASFQAKINACNKAISEKIIEHIRSEYEFTEPVANIVFDAAYERGHSCGYDEVIHYAREYAEFTEQLSRQWTCAKTERRKIMSKGKSFEATIRVPLETLRRTYREINMTGDELYAKTGVKRNEKLLSLDVKFENDYSAEINAYPGEDEHTGFVEMILTDAESDDRILGYGRREYPESVRVFGWQYGLHR